MRYWGALICFMAACGGPQEKSEMSKSPVAPVVQGDKTTSPAKLVFADDIEQRLAKFEVTEIDFDETLISAGDRAVLIKLVEAAQILDDIFLDQVSPDNRALRARLEQENVPPAVKEYFNIMYGPWDRLQSDEPFIGSASKPLGAGFYSPEITKVELAAWIKKHPADEQKFHGYFSVIRRDKGGKLTAVPYSQAYRKRLQRAARLLLEAANKTTHGALKTYLQLRAKAFMDDDYFASDMAWMDLGDSPLEVVLGPYEVYEDRLMGYKAAFESFITLRDEVYSRRLQKLAKYNLELEKDLPLPKKYFTKRGSASPISVVIELFASGDTRAGVQTAAFNLPNDERVRSQKGSKKVMLKNVTEAKFNKVLIPIAKRAIAPKLLDLVQFDAYFTDILLHEVAHGMGPGKITVEGRKTEVNRELKELYPAIEECKADIVGLVNGAKLVKKGALPRKMAKQLPACYLAGIFRAVRFGVEEAHAKAVLLGFNYLLKHKAITYNSICECFDIDYKRFNKTVTELARELLLVEAKGSYAGAQALLKQYGGVSPEMKKVLDKLASLPVDIRPQFTILEKMKGW